MDRPGLQQLEFLGMEGGVPARHSDAKVRREHRREQVLENGKESIPCPLEREGIYRPPALGQGLLIGLTEQAQ